MNDTQDEEQFVVPEYRAHPTIAKLEAHAAGDTNAEVGAHLERCVACLARVTQLRAELSVFSERAVAEGPTFLAESKKRAVLIQRREKIATIRNWVVISGFAAAAAIALFFALTRAAPAQLALRTTAEHERTSDGEIANRFKGAASLTLIREHDGAQERLAHAVTVHAGDRIRIEVAAPGEVALAAGLLSRDGKYLPMIPAETLSHGTHFSLDAVRFDAEPFDGWVILGTPSDIAAAQRTKDLHNVQAIGIRSVP